MAAFLGFIGLFAFFAIQDNGNFETLRNRTDNTIIKSILPSPTATPIPLPDSHVIPLKTHVFQSFNNCGPATLSMALSYLGITKTQAELGQALRPYQVPGGDNDDKSVTLQEVADHAKSLGLNSYLRPNGNMETIQKFIANDIPVVTRTWLKADEDIGHYRVVRGYDKIQNTVLQDDSLQGKNLTYSYGDFVKIWQPFNYEYLVIVDQSKKELAEQLLGEEIDEKIAWRNALERIEREQEENDSYHLQFAKSRIYYYLGDYKRSVEEFNKVENSLSFRTLWYQIEPILAIYETGDYDRLFSLSERILNDQNRAFSELYILRGKAYQKLGNLDAARSEFEKAVMYNQNHREAKDLLNSV